MHDPEPLGRNLCGHLGKTSDVTGRPIETCNEASFDGVPAVAEHDRNSSGGSFSSLCAQPVARRDDDGHPTANQLRRQCWQPINLPLSREIIDYDVLAFDIAGFVQAFADRCKEVRPAFGVWKEVEMSNDRQWLLLRPYGERPCHRAADKRDELAPSHSITSSARASRVGGTSRPSSFAVLRLITISYLVGFCTGRSAGLSPLRMRLT